MKYVEWDDPWPISKTGITNVHHKMSLEGCIKYSMYALSILYKDKVITPELALDDFLLTFNAWITEDVSTS